MFHRSHTPRPTVVLVHGAFADSTSWNDVARELRREGHPQPHLAELLAVLGQCGPLGPLVEPATAVCVHL
ncbi:hypothetical protein AB0H35_32220, partial [Streptomyces pseudogriseolus]